MYKRFLLIGSGKFVNEIQPALAGLALEIDIANVYDEIRPKLKRRDIDLVIFDEDSFSSNLQILKNITALLHRSDKNFIVLSRKKNSKAVLESGKAGASYHIVKPYTIRELNLILSAVLNNKKKISCIGGGTGLFNTLMGLKDLPEVMLTSVVSMTDSGGSSGRLSELFGVLPPGDVRRSLVALSNAPKVMNDIIAYRFDSGGDLAGHNLGNILLTALTKIKGSMSEAVSGLGDILNIRGIVRPISATKSVLCAMFSNGAVIKGESNIDLCKGRSPELRIKKCWHEPASKTEANAYSAIINSDIVIMGPGDLYTSVITNLVIRDIRDAVVRTRAKKIYICNLMTKPGETPGYTAFDHIKDILKYLKKDCLDYVIIADIAGYSKNALLKYARKRQFPVTASAADIKKIKTITNAKIIIADVAHEIELIRHDSDKVKNEIFKIISKGK